MVLGGTSICMVGVTIMEQLHGCGDVTEGNKGDIIRYDDDAEHYHHHLIKRTKGTLLK